MCWISILCDIATVIIALVNVILVIWIFVRQNKIDKQDDEKSHQYSLKLNIIMEHRMQLFYKYYDDLKNVLALLMENNLTNQNKVQVNNQMLEYSGLFDNEFLQLFEAVDESMGKDLRKVNDEMVDNITKSIFDEGINLYVRNMYHDHIDNRIITARKKMLKIMYDRL